MPDFLCKMMKYIVFSSALIRRRFLPQKYVTHNVTWPSSLCSVIQHTLYQPDIFTTISNIIKIIIYKLKHVFLLFIFYWFSLFMGIFIDIYWHGFSCDTWSLKLCELCLTPALLRPHGLKCFWFVRSLSSLFFYPHSHTYTARTISCLLHICLR